MPMLGKGLQTLNRKRFLNYRRGTEDRKCSLCVNFVPDFKVQGIGSFTHQEYRKIAPRCEVMGLEHSIRYQVHRDFVCDEFNPKSPS